jgi:hypothetical protein
MYEYIIYALWIGLGVLALVILYFNNKVKKQNAADQAKEYPKIELAPFEREIASGEISVFFVADEPIDYELFIVKEETKEETMIQKGRARAGGQKMPLDTTVFENGAYFYGIRTPHHTIEKKIRIQN